MQNAPPRYNPPVRKLRRIVFNSLTVLSLLLLLTAIALRIRSAHTCDLIYRFSSLPDMDGMGDALHLDGGNGFQVGSSRGRVWIGVGGMEIRMEIIAQHWNERLHWETSHVANAGSGYTMNDLLDLTSPRPRFAGFDFVSNSPDRPRGDRYGHRIVFPHWFLAVAVSAAPSIGLLKSWRRRSRVRVGQCQQCGYDLRATPARCPGCGMAAD
jgi:hypothetical protein